MSFENYLTRATTGEKLFVYDPAIFKPDDPIPISGIGFGVRYLDDGGAFVVQALEHVHDLFALGRMQVSGRLVGQDDARIRNHCARDTDELLLTTGQLRGKQVFLAYHLKAIERVANDRLPVFLADVAIRKRQLEVLEHRLIVEQVITLKNETDVAVAQCRALPRVELVDRHVVEVILAGP